MGLGTDPILRQPTGTRPPKIADHTRTPRWTPPGLVRWSSGGAARGRRRLVLVAPTEGALSDGFQVLAHVEHHLTAGLGGQHVVGAVGILAEAGDGDRGVLSPDPPLIWGPGR